MGADFDDVVMFISEALKEYGAELRETPYVDYEENAGFQVRVPGAPWVEVMVLRPEEG